MKNWETFMGLTIGKELAKEINRALEVNNEWMMPKGRFLMATFESDQVTSSGIIIPDKADESKPKLGVIVYQQPMEQLADGSDETYCDFDLTDNFVGKVATIGLYSGKEVHAGGIQGVKEILEKHGLENKITFKVISAAEVAFIQPNYN